MARIAVSGSIATDHLMSFPGRFAEQLIADQLHTVSLSFLVDDLTVRRGGVAANIAFGLGRLGLRPVLIGAVGADFAEYRAWLERHGVDCGSVLVSTTAHTARFVCTTDRDMCQIASFYPGAMAEASRIRLSDVVARTGRPDLVHVGADDPVAMLARAAECRALGLPFAADPSQQLATMSGVEVRAFVAGAEFLLTNEYEGALLQERTGLTDAQVLDLVGHRVTTLGAAGVRITGADGTDLRIPAARTGTVADPTGVGDGFRAGFLTGLVRRASLTDAARLGCVLAAYVIESVGTQEYRLDQAGVTARLAESYGITLVR